jgi:hypothetical protein
VAEASRVGLDGDALIDLVREVGHAQGALER